MNTGSIVILLVNIFFLIVDMVPGLIVKIKSELD